MQHAFSIGMNKLEEWLEHHSLPKQILVVYALAAIVALAAGFLVTYRSGPAMLDYDEWEYWQLAASLLQGSFDDPGRRTLGYPIILAGLRLLWNNFYIVQAMVTLLAATAAPLLSIAMLRAGASRAAALLGGMTLAVWPPQIFLSSSLYSEAVALPLLLLFLVILPQARDGRTSTWRAWLTAGLVLGVVAHVRTMYQLFIPFLLVALLFDRLSHREALGRWLIVVAGFLAVVLPWSAYVTEKTGQPMLLTANGGETLAGGLTPRLFAMDGGYQQLANRSTTVGPGKWVAATATGYLTTAETKLPYTEQDKLLRDRVVRWVWQNPGDAAYLSMRKLAYQWGIHPFLSNPPEQLILGNLPILVLSALFLLGLATQPACRQLGARFYLMPLFVIAIALISWGSWRFRQPADAAMIAVVAVALTTWLAYGRPQSERQRTRAAV